MTWEDALKERIRAAKEAMDYYREKKMEKEYIDSEKAKIFNEHILIEGKDTLSD